MNNDQTPKEMKSWQYNPSTGKTGKKTKVRLIITLIVVAVIFATQFPPTANWISSWFRSTDDLSVQVRQAITQEFAKKPDTKNIIIHSFALVKASGNQYNGILEVSAPEGERQKIPVNVTYDGKTMMWQIDGIYMMQLRLMSQ